MAFLTYNDVGISAIAACVPKKVLNNNDLEGFFSKKEIKSVSRLTGIIERRVADENICSSDLCFEAANRLLNETEIDRETIDVLIFISQTPDFRMPATSIIISKKLGLNKSCACFDVNLGCSGYTYGLTMAYSYANKENIRRVLLLNGETRTKVYSFKDKSSGLLFGDGGTATLVEKGDYGKSWFSVNADGNRHGLIMIPGGGYKTPSSLETIKEKEYPDGSIRTLENGIMDGPGVFDFTIDEIPKNITDLLSYSGYDIMGISHFLLHQANKFITDHIAKKLKIPLDRVPYSIHKYGNTSSVSIPLNACSELHDKEIGKTLICGFGVGLSWGTGIIDLTKTILFSVGEL